MGVADAMNDFFFFKAYQRTSVAIAVLTHYLAPLFVAIGAPFLLRERPSRATYGAVAIGFCGLVLLLQPWNAASRPTDSLGALFGAASALFYASNVLFTKRLAHAFSGSEQMFFHCFVALPILVLLVPRAEWGAINVHATAVVALGSLGPGALASLFFVWGAPPRAREPRVHAHATRAARGCFHRDRRLWGGDRLARARRGRAHPLRRRAREFAARVSSRASAAASASSVSRFPALPSLSSRGNSRRARRTRLYTPCLMGPKETPRDRFSSGTIVKPGSVLVVDDDDALRMLVVKWLTKAGLTCIEAKSGEEALSNRPGRSQKGSTRSCATMMMPGLDGFARVLEQLKAEPATAAIPVMLLTAHANTEGEIVRGLEGGAVDHLAKPFSGPVLSAKVRALVERGRGERSLQKKLRFAEKRATIDGLTGLFNRRQFETRHREESAHARRHSRPLALVLFDLDHFKSINDTFGHEEGDRVLQQVGTAIPAVLRTGGFGPSGMEARSSSSSFCDCDAPSAILVRGAICPREPEGQAAAPSAPPKSYA